MQLTESPAGAMNSLDEIVRSRILDPEQNPGRSVLRPIQMTSRTPGHAGGMDVYYRTRGVLGVSATDELTEVDTEVELTAIRGDRRAC